MNGTPPPGYEIDVDIDRRFVKLTLIGFWDLAMYERYTNEIDAMAENAAKAGRSRQDYRVMIDLRKHGLQSQDVAANIQAGLMKKSAANKRRHAVLVSASALHKTQVQRVGGSIHARLFVDQGEAMEWLLDQD